MLILGFLSDAVTRRRFGWALLVLAMVGVVSPFIGFGLIFGPGGGNQNTTAGGIGFLIVLCGFPLFLLAFVWSVLLGIGTIISDRRGRRIQVGASAPTSRP